MTALQWLSVAFGLLMITALLGLIILVAFQREDRKAERRRAMDKHPSTQERRWDDEDQVS
jgi:hypothetical protein